MTLIQFLITYFLFVGLGTLTVSGWFFITRGREEKLPDGSIQKKGKIFKGWYFYFTRIESVSRIFYSGAELEKLYCEYLSLFPKNDYGIIKSEGNEYLIIEKKDADFSDLFIKFGKKFVKTESIIRFYEEKNNYRFPEWIRDPLAVCATCFSSIYGSIFYWSVITLSCDAKLFSWAANATAAVVFFWVFFCMSLAVLNTAIAKKFN